KSQSFYGFKSLYIYKQKFTPQRWEPLYLVTLTGDLNWRMFLGLFLALYPKGLLQTGLASFLRILRRFDLAEMLNEFFADRVVLRTMPKNFVQLLSRMRASFFFVFI